MSLHICYDASGLVGTTSTTCSSSMPQNLATDAEEKSSDHHRKDGRVKLYSDWYCTGFFSHQECSVYIYIDIHKYNPIHLKTILGEESYSCTTQEACLEQT